jgi:tetratricopeptide (TPR) repeat protein
MKPHVAARRAKRVLAEAQEAHLANDFVRSNDLALKLWRLGDHGAPGAKAQSAYHQFYYNFRVTRDYAKAERLISFAIQNGADTQNAWHNLGLARRDQGNARGAMEAFATALQFNPDFLDSLVTFGNVAWEAGEDALAREAWERALIATPGPGASTYDQGCHRIMMQRYYGEGWKQYGSRWDAPLFRAAHERPVGPVWDGTPVETLFLFAEQGNGDAIMLIRWLPWVLSRCERLHLAVHGPLTQLVRENFPGVIVQRLEDPIPAYHAHASLFELPALAGLSDPQAVPRAPYLRSTKTYPWGQSTKRVGLVWAGGTGTAHDWRRSIPFETVKPLLDVPLGWYVLQMERLEDFDASGCKVPVWHRDVNPLPNFTATAKALMSLNLLITVDTAIAHLAGALGVPTWLLIPRMPDFRWGIEGERTPWYGSVRLFRQEKAGDWPSVVERVKSELEAWSMEAKAA